MRFFTKAALLATAVCAASGAQAATYVSYEIRTIGSGAAITDTGPFGPPASYNEYANAIFNFVLNLDLSSQTATSETVSTGAVGPGVFAGGSVFGMATEGVLTLRQETVGQIGNGSGIFSATICPTGTGNRLPLGSVQTNGCGDGRSISLDFVGSAGFRNTYRGAVQFVQGSVFQADNAATGLVRITPGVPEPSTWALMLAGFGLVGYSLRRRAKVAFA
ncbi:PEPxxWA-CTERM sorting domain-containing protein [Sphingomonas sp. 1P08PE]|uniref:PEPxxWA-CTERM sorting domain-containing protein n=1 Tax=Sphingomonas sp. 1P08PE TaxID=554122 RepID=UPI0039A24D31